MVSLCLSYNKSGVVVRPSLMGLSICLVVQDLVGCYLLAVELTPCVGYICYDERDEKADDCHCLEGEQAAAAVLDGERALQVGV